MNIEEEKNEVGIYLHNLWNFEGWELELGTSTTQYKPQRTKCVRAHTYIDERISYKLEAIILDWNLFALLWNLKGLGLELSPNIA